MVSQKKIRRCRISDHRSDIAYIAKTIKDDIYDYPSGLSDIVCSTIVVAAIHDARMVDNPVDFITVVEDYLEVEIFAWLSSKEITTEIEQSSSNYTMPNSRDREDGNYEPIEVVDVVEMRSVIDGISDEVPAHINWEDDESLQHHTGLLVEVISDAISEIDLLSFDEYNRLAEYLRDVLLTGNCSVLDIDEFYVNWDRAMIGVKLKDKFYDPMNLLSERAA